MIDLKDRPQNASFEEKEKLAIEKELSSALSTFDNAIEEGSEDHRDIVTRLFESFSETALRAPFEVCSTVDNLLGRYGRDDILKARMLKKCSNLLAHLVAGEEARNEGRENPQLAHEIEIEDSPANVLLEIMAKHAEIHKRFFCGVYGKALVCGVEKVLFVSPAYGDSPVCFATINLPFSKPSLFRGISNLLTRTLDVSAGNLADKTVFTIGKFSGKAKRGDFKDPPIHQQRNADALSYNEFVRYVREVATTWTSQNETKMILPLKEVLFKGFLKGVAERPENTIAATRPPAPTP